MNMKLNIIIVTFLAISGAFLSESEAHEGAGYISSSPISPAKLNDGVCYKKVSQICVNTIFDSFCRDNIGRIANGCCYWLSIIGWDCFTEDMVKEAKAKHICDNRDVQERAHNLWAACEDPTMYDKYY